VPIVVIIVPIFLPLLQVMKVNMVWFSILLAVTLQTCWLSPPVALSAYYLKGVIPRWDLAEIYKGMLPFMALQWGAVLILYFYPQIVLVLPNMMFGTR
jgi:TRAP-type mannitol/chloroaromatic compound transport system permease large subunit